jgi:transcriptional regulator with XRE-family HTH domain
MFEPTHLASVRHRLELSQEQMAQLLGVSFASVNRWEGGHSAPTGSVLDLYNALNAAIRSGYSAGQIRKAANSERGLFLYNLFRMAYGPARKRA